MPIGLLIPLLIELIKDVVIPLEPVVVKAFEDWQAGTITAQQADEAAGGAFSAMLARLTDPHKDAAATNAAADAALAAKFPAT